MRLKNSSKPLLKQNLSLETPTKLFLSVFLFVYFPLTSTKLPKIPFSLGIPKENRLIFVLSINFWLLRPPSKDPLREYWVLPVLFVSVISPTHRNDRHAWLWAYAKRNTDHISGFAYVKRQPTDCLMPPPHRRPHLFSVSSAGSDISRYRKCISCHNPPCIGSSDALSGHIYRKGTAGRPAAAGCTYCRS